MIRSFFDQHQTTLVTLEIRFQDQAVSELFKLKARVRLDELASKLESLKKRGVSIIKYTDTNYPKLLRDLQPGRNGAPLIMFHRGSLFDFDKCVAVAGTRVLSYEGHVMARRLSRTIAAAGYTIVSGLARGADTEAHCGALEAKEGKTIAVLAWLDPIYPPENSELAGDIERRGAVLSQICESPGKLATAKFVERNRITSGISRCVVVIESDEEGGTVHQVRLAIGQGRKVFAVKPRTTNVRAMRGFRLFHEMGATPITSARPVLDYLRAGEADESIDSYLNRQTKLSRI